MKRFFASMLSVMLLFLCSCGTAADPSGGGFPAVTAAGTAVSPAPAVTPAPALTAKPSATPPATPPATPTPAPREAGKMWTMTIDDHWEKPVEEQFGITLSSGMTLSMSKEGGDDPFGEYRGEIAFDYSMDMGSLGAMLSQMGAKLDYDLDGWGKSANFTLELIPFDADSYSKFLSDSAGMPVAPPSPSGGRAYCKGEDFSFEDKDFSGTFDIDMGKLLGVSVTGNEKGAVGSGFSIATGPISSAVEGGKLPWVVLLSDDGSVSFTFIGTAAEGQTPYDIMTYKGAVDNVPLDKTVKVTRPAASVTPVDPLWPGDLLPAGFPRYTGGKIINSGGTREDFVVLMEGDSKTIGAYLALLGEEGYTVDDTARTARKGGVSVSFDDRGGTWQMSGNVTSLANWPDTIPAFITAPTGKKLVGEPYLDDMGTFVNLTLDVADMTEAEGRAWLGALSKSWKDGSADETQWSGNVQHKGKTWSVTAEIYGVDGGNFSVTFSWATE